MDDDIKLNVFANEFEDPIVVAELLHHTHLPKLEAANIIEIDDGVIRRGPNWDEIEPLLTIIDENRERLPWF